MDNNVKVRIKKKEFITNNAKTIKIMNDGAITEAIIISPLRFLLFT